MKKLYNITLPPMRRSHLGQAQLLLKVTSLATQLSVKSGAHFERGLVELASFAKSASGPHSAETEYYSHYLTYAGVREGALSKREALIGLNEILLHMLKLPEGQLSEGFLIVETYCLAWLSYLKDEMVETA